MAKVSSRYDSRFVEFMKSIGGEWDPQSRTWTVPEDRVAEVEAKARELGVRNFKIIREASSQQEGTIRMRLSRDGRFVLISVNLIAFRRRREEDARREEADRKVQDAAASTAVKIDASTVLPLFRGERRFRILKLRER